MACVDGVLVSVGTAQTCEEACDGERCVSSGACDGFTIQVCRYLASCLGEGAYRHVSIDDAFLGCEDTEACYYARDGVGRSEVVVRGYVDKLRAPRWPSTAGRYRGGVVNKLDKGLADGVGLDEEPGVGAVDGAELAKGLADKPVERRRRD